jgi:stage IV sporulation protein A
MAELDLYRDIAERTNGDIYLGVVGPVRTGKSTFIKKFMDLLVLPNVEDGFERDRVVDELPQSGSGRTIMTTQPHFVPNEAVRLNLGEKAHMDVRMVDCVGYMVRGAMGHMEGETPRMVRTPWFDHDIPFEDAAEIGTKKVINDHSTIGVVMVTDGTITDIPRSSYIEPEERVIAELKELGKPFVVVLNSSQPKSDDAQKLCESLKQKHEVPVILVDVAHLCAEDIQSMLEAVLLQFPMKMLHIEMPGWVQALPMEHWLLGGMISKVREILPRIGRVRDYESLVGAFSASEHFAMPQLQDISLGEGKVKILLDPVDGLFYRVLGEECGYPIDSDKHLISIIKELVAAKKEYDRVSGALESVRKTGYGLVPPMMEELSLEEPEIVRQGNRFGVRLKASAPSFHMRRNKLKGAKHPCTNTHAKSFTTKRTRWPSYIIPTTFAG